MTYPDNEEIERTNKIIQTFNIKNGARINSIIFEK